MTQYLSRNWNFQTWEINYLPISHVWNENGIDNGGREGKAPGTGLKRRYASLILFKKIAICYVGCPFSKRYIMWISFFSSLFRLFFMVYYLLIATTSKIVVWMKMSWEPSACKHRRETHSLASLFSWHIFTTGKSIVKYKEKEDSNLEIYQRPSVLEPPELRRDRLRKSTSAKWHSINSPPFSPPFSLCSFLRSYIILTNQ